MSGLGLDLARSALRWHFSPPEAGHPEGGVLYRPCGCPESREYVSSEKWGDPFALRRHVFNEGFPGAGQGGGEKTADLLFPSGDGGDGAGWLRSVLASRGLPSRGLPFRAVAPGRVAAAAVPDHAAPDLQDAVLDALSERFSSASPYLLWRPVAMALAWMESLREAGRDASALIGRRAITVDLDGGRPEAALVTFRRHKKRKDRIVPVHALPRRDTILPDDGFGDEAYAAVLGHVPEYRQLLNGQFAPEIQEALESGAREKEVWIRARGAWDKRRIVIPGDLPGEGLWDRLDALLRAVRRGGKDPVLLFNGWAARRFEARLRNHFGRETEELSVLPAFAVARGCALFAERVSNGEPTYYDRIPDYRIWDGKKGEFTPLFPDRDCREPGEECRDDGLRKYDIERFNDNVSVHVQLRPDDGEPPDDDFSRRLKVNFNGSIREKVTVRLQSVVRVARGSARFTFRMEDGEAPPIFLVKQKPSREVALRWYSSDQDSLNGVEVEKEPKRRGFPDPQPVLGRIYDPDDDFFCLRMLKAFLENRRGPEYQKLFQQFKEKFPTENVRFFTSRVGYSVGQPTRGLFGTKEIPCRREIGALSAEYANLCWNGRTVVCSIGNEFLPQCMTYRYMNCAKNCYLLHMNLFHSVAPEGYKNAIRRFLREQRELNTFNFYYAPGYVLGDREGDLDLLLDYIRRRPVDPKTTPKLWWSVFRMQCWHPEARAGDAGLLAKCLEKLCREDAQACQEWDKKFLVLAILFCLRVREDGRDLPEGLQEDLCGLLEEGALQNIDFPPTMVPNLDTASQKEGDTLSAYTARFIRRQDDLRDRELGACFGEV